MPQWHPHRGKGRDTYWWIVCPLFQGVIQPGRLRASCGGKKYCRGGEEANFGLNVWVLQPKILLMYYLVHFKKKKCIVLDLVNSCHISSLCTTLWNILVVLKKIHTLCLLGKILHAFLIRTETHCPSADLQWCHYFLNGNPMHLLTCIFACAKTHAAVVSVWLNLQRVQGLLSCVSRI